MADDKELIDQSLDALSRGDSAPSDEEIAGFEAVADEIADARLQDAIFERYLAHGRHLLSDAAPQSLDPRMIARLKPLLGDVSNVRVHTGAMASAAAQAMSARAFAIGDQDIFMDRAEYDPHSRAGVGLLAHEVAHTRDPDIAFAREALTPDSSAAEARADAVAELATQNFDRAGSDTPAVAAPAGQEAAKGKKKLSGDDKRKVEDMVMSILERQERLARERTGR